VDARTAIQAALAELMLESGKKPKPHAVLLFYCNNVVVQKYNPFPYYKIKTLGNVVNL